MGKYLHVWISEIGEWDNWRCENLRIIKNQTHSHAGRFRAPNKNALVNSLNSTCRASSARDRFRKHAKDRGLLWGRLFRWGDIVVQGEEAWMMIHPVGWVPVEMQTDDIAERIEYLKPKIERQADGIADVGGHR